jgi:hypothetical protein
MPGSCSVTFTVETLPLNELRIRLTCRACRILERRDITLLEYQFFYMRHPIMFAVQGKEISKPIKHNSLLLKQSSLFYSNKELCWTGLLLFLFVEYELVELYVFLSPSTYRMLV